MFGWFGGRGRGWGATLGYCPWTGLPRGWRWYWPYSTYPYGGYWQGYTPYQTQPWTYGQYSTPYQYQAPPFNEREALENEYKYLQERLEEVKRRLDQLQK